MYNYGSLLHHIYSVGAVLALGLITTIGYILDKEKKRDILLLCVVLIMVFIFWIQDVAAYFNPKIMCFEGYYKEQHRASKSLFNTEYWFVDDGPGISVTMDVFTAKEIYTEEFDKTQKYRVYYEDSTKMIVKIEEID